MRKKIKPNKPARVSRDSSYNCYKSWLCQGIWQGLQKHLAKVLEVHDIRDKSGFSPG